MSSFKLKILEKLPGSSEVANNLAIPYKHLIPLRSAVYYLPLRPKIPAQ